MAIASSAGILGFGVGASFATSFVMFMVIRFFVGIAVMSLFSIGFVYSMQREAVAFLLKTIKSNCFFTSVPPPSPDLEIIGGKWLEIIGIAAQFNYSVGLITVPFIALALPTWNMFQLVITLPTALILAATIVMPESPRWLLSVGRMTEAKRMIKFIMWLNGKKFPKGKELHAVVRISEIW